jgi:membrane protein required for colicin V production
MHWLDCTILALLAAAGVLGAYSGLLMQVFRLAGFAASLYAASCLHGWATHCLQGSLMKGTDPRAASAVAFASVFLVIYLAIFLATLLGERGVRAAQLQYVNRGLGALLGVLKMGLLIGAVSYGLQQLPHEPTRQIVDDSVIAPLLAQGVDQAIAAVPAEYKNDVSKSWQQVRDSLPAKGGKLGGERTN